MVVWDSTTVVAEPAELVRLTCEPILCDRYSNVECCITTAVTGSKTNLKAMIYHRKILCQSIGMERFSVLPRLVTPSENGFAEPH